MTARRKSGGTKKVGKKKAGKSSKKTGKKMPGRKKKKSGNGSETGSIWKRKP